MCEEKANLGDLGWNLGFFLGGEPVDTQGVFQANLRGNHKGSI